MTGSHVTRFGALAAIIACLALATFMPVFAQAGCGSSVTVAAGDTLLRIAQRCNTTVEAILAANPGIGDPSLIFVGQEIALPGASAEPEPTESGTPAGEEPAAAEVDAANTDDSEGQPLPQTTLDGWVVAYPARGGAGTGIEVIGNDLVESEEVIIGIGQPGQDYVGQRTVRTSERGGVMTQVIVPDDVGDAGSWIVVISTDDGTEGAFSNRQQPAVAIMPVSGPVGTSVTIIANNFPPDTDVQLNIDGDQTGPRTIGTVRTSADGALMTEMTVPDLPADERIVVIASTDTLAATSGRFAVTAGAVPPPAPVSASEAWVDLEPKSGPPGTSVNLQVTGFPGDSRVIIGLGQENAEFTVMYVTRTDLEGMLNLNILIPDFVAPDQTWTAVVRLPDGQLRAVSKPFSVTAPEGSEATVEAAAPAVTRLSLYLVALNDNGQSGAAVGCGDSLVPVTVEFPASEDPLRAAIRGILAIGSQFYGQSGLYSPLYHSSLSIENVAVADGVAAIALNGTIALDGECDAARVIAQLEQTALQFEGVESVTISVNGQPLADALSAG